RVSGPGVGLQCDAPKLALCVCHWACLGCGSAWQHRAFKKSEVSMRVIASEFMSLGGVMQAPGGPEEDTTGGFRHGGWSMQFFDPEVMGQAVGEFAERCEALLQGRRTYQVSAAAWPKGGGDPFPDWINR